MPAYRTYEEWSARGRQVLSGEEHMGRLNDGTALFEKKQTCKKQDAKVGSKPTVDRSRDSWDMGEQYDYS